MSVHLRVDALFNFIANGLIAPWLRASDKQNRTVTRAVAAAACEYARGGYFVVIDGVVLPPMLELYEAQLRSACLDLDYCVLLPGLEVNVERGLSRVEKPNALTDDVYREMHRQFRATVFNQRHMVDSSALSPGATADEVLRRLASGELRIDGAASVP
jgi:hypothetical protein